MRGLYRYRVADRGFRAGLNTYPRTVTWKGPGPVPLNTWQVTQRKVIGVYLVVGRYAYCIKWKGTP